MATVKIKGKRVYRDGEHVATIVGYRESDPRWESPGYGIKPVDGEAETNPSGKYPHPYFSDAVDAAKWTYAKEEK